MRRSDVLDSIREIPAQGDVTAYWPVPGQELQIPKVDPCCWANVQACASLFSSAVLKDAAVNGTSVSAKAGVVDVLECRVVLHANRPGASAAVLTLEAEFAHELLTGRVATSVIEMDDGGLLVSVFASKSF